MNDFSPRFPDFLDNTMLSSFRACPKQFFWKYIHRLQFKGKNIHLCAGGAFARGIEIARKMYYDKGQSPELALQAGVLAAMKAYDIEDIPEDHAKSCRAVCEALIGYLERWPFEQDYVRPVKMNGRHWVEFTFNLPLPIVHPVTGLPLLYCGRCDMIGEFNGAIYSVDEKTCSSMGDKWARQFDMRGQFMGYNWAAREHGFQVTGTIVRGIKFIKSGQEFAETIVMHNERKIAMWYEQTLRDVRRMIECWNTGYWDKNLSDSCTAYSGCGYGTLDDALSPETYFDDFVENTWNPLDKGD